jgi:hypothetical protein
VTQVTLWWNGSDMATQTPNAYANLYFQNDNPNVTETTGFLSNGRLNLTIERTDDSIDHAQVFKVTSVVGTSSSTTKFMRINNENSTYGASSAYVIHHGIVRDIVHQEAEWDKPTTAPLGGADGCPNVYASIVLTLPANATYYTYQLRLMFINSTQSRTITDLCPIKLSTTLSPVTIQTENGTIDNVVNGTGTFSNYASGSGWTAHHWSQINSTSGAGAGILFTDTSNILLYAFDSIAGNPTGALKTDTSSKIIELDPVSLLTVTPFTSAMDITWKGAIATFDSSSTPVYYLNAGQPAGLWILAEFQPQITVTAET